MRPLFLILVIWTCNLLSYEKPLSVPGTTWEQVLPYLLPENHPIKATLDRLFNPYRVTLNLETLQNAGFLAKQGRYTTVVVARHPDLKGYLIKLFTDENPLSDDWIYWKRRVEGAQIIREAIYQHGYEKWFDVPYKWIYPLPEEPAPPSTHYKKNFILVVEDMNLLGKKKNFAKWEESMTPQKLLAIHTLLSELGLDDSIYPWNIPFKKDGKMAFIDTERFYRWPVPMQKLLPYLSPPMQHYWLYLDRNKNA